MNELYTCGEIKILVKMHNRQLAEVKRGSQCRTRFSVELIAVLVGRVLMRFAV